MKRELKWKRMLKERATNPEWGKGLLEAIIMELENRDTPDLTYIRKKLDVFSNSFLKDLELAQTVWLEEERAKKKPSFENSHDPTVEAP